MPARTLPNLGLKAFYDLGEDGWKDDQDLNLLVLSALVQATAVAKVSADPGAPVDGDIYVFDETHPTHANAIAIRDDGAWVFVTPNPGWLIFNQAGADYLTFDGATWTELETGGGGGSSGPAPSSTQAGTSYTAVLGDANTYIRFTNAAAVVFTIPPNASVAFPLDTVISVEQAGAGAVTLTPGSGVTLNSRGGLLQTGGQYAVCQLKKIGTNTWTVIGDVA